MYMQVHVRKLHVKRGYLGIRLHHYYFSDLIRGKGRWREVASAQMLFVSHTQAIQMSEYATASHQNHELKGKLMALQ